MGENTQNQADGTPSQADIKVGSFKKKHNLKVVKGKGVLPALCLLLIVAAGTATYLHGHKHPAAIAQQPKSARRQIGDATKAFMTGNKQDIAALDEAETKLADLEQNAQTPADAIQYAGTQVDLYQQAGKYDKAMTKALETDQTYHTAVTAATVGTVYELQANYAKAAEYYQLAADRSPKTGPTQNSAYNDYLRMKKDMEARLQ